MAETPEKITSLKVRVEEHGRAEGQYYVRGWDDEWEELEKCPKCGRAVQFHDWKEQKILDRPWNETPVILYLKRHCHECKECGVYPSPHNQIRQVGEDYKITLALDQQVKTHFLREGRKNVEELFGLGDDLAKRLEEEVKEALEAGDYERLGPEVRFEVLIQKLQNIERDEAIVVSGLSSAEAQALKDYVSRRVDTEEVRFRLSQQVRGDEILGKWKGLLSWDPINEQSHLRDSGSRIVLTIRRDNRTHRKVWPHRQVDREEKIEWAAKVRDRYMEMTDDFVRKKRIRSHFQKKEDEEEKAKVEEVGGSPEAS